MSVVPKSMYFQLSVLIHVDRQAQTGLKKCLSHFYVVGSRVGLGRGVPSRFELQSDFEMGIVAGGKRANVSNCKVAIWGKGLGGYPQLKVGFGVLPQEIFEYVDP